MLTIQSLQEKGANTKEGLERCLNNEQIYLRLVKKVLTDESFEKLKNAIAENDLDTAFTVAHNLKGSSGNLSLTPLYNSLVEITELLRSRTQTDYTPYLNAVLENKESLASLCSD